MNSYDPDGLRRWMASFVEKLQLRPVNPGALTMEHIEDAMRYVMETSLNGIPQASLSAAVFNGLSDVLKNKKKK